MSEGAQQLLGDGDTWTFVRASRRGKRRPRALGFAVRTASEFTAVLIVNRVLADAGARARGAGEINGIEWMTVEAWEDRFKVPHPYRRLPGER